jgi:mannose-1-phosphate guanylyltransferase
MLTLVDSEKYVPQRLIGRTDDDKNAWALVLAAGEGSRLKALTMTPAGAHVPKQFCSLLGGPSLMHEALNRAESVAPPGRVCTIVAAQHRRWWERLPERLPESNVIVQPENRGTANGILLALMRISARDRNARVVLLPSDHHVENELRLADSLRCAAEHLRLRPNEILLLGIEAGEPDPELGYIVPGDRSRDGTFEIVKFVEKPTAPIARQLIESGALWNSFIVAGTVHALLHLLRRRFPDIVDAMRDVVQRDQRRPNNPIATAGLYACLPSLDFSRDVLSNERGPSLRVLAVPQCGWSDLGNLTRIAATLRRARSAQLPGGPASGRSAQISLAARLERVLHDEKLKYSSASPSPR